jgi:outer membrane protein TolC
MRPERPPAQPSTVHPPSIHARRTPAPARPRRRTTATVALSLLLLSAPAIAQSELPAVWSEAQVISRAVSRAPAVQSAQSQLFSAQASQTFGRVPLVGNPTLGVRAMVGVPDREAATYGLVLGVPLDLSGARGHYRRETSWAARAAEAELDAAVNDARGRAREAHIEIATADAMVAVTRARVETAREIVARSQARARAQASTALDVALTDRELGEAEANLAAALREREQAAGRLRELLDLPAGTSVAVEPVGAPALPADLSREGAIARATERRREAAAYAARAMQLRLSGDRLRAQSIAPLYVAGEVEWQGYSQASVGASVQWSLPMFQFAQGERAVALAEAAGADTQQRLARHGAAREAGTLWDQLERSLEELRAIETHALPALERSLALTEDLFEAGAVDSFRVLLIRQDLAAMRIRQLTAVREAWRTRVALDRAIGGL